MRTVQYLLGDLAVPVGIAALHDGLGEVCQVGGVVVLANRVTARVGEGEDLLDELQQVLQEAAQLLVLDDPAGVLTVETGQALPPLHWRDGLACAGWPFRKVQ